MDRSTAHADKPRSTPFGEWLTTWRIAKGMRQTDLAKLLDLHPGRISEFETGLRRPSLALRGRIQEALGDDVPPPPAPWR